MSAAQRHPRAQMAEEHQVRADSLRHHPPLDGLRGLALLAIIVYHSGLTFAPGAFLSVSTFFTLSGFLITALLLAEFERDRSVSLRGFWSRRLRRLMPAALAAIFLIVVASIWLADDTQWVRLRADALAAVAYVANWRFIAAGDSYGAGFESPSPFTHFWTLAIEEQLYVVLPLVVVGALVAGRGSRRAVAAVLGVLALSSVVWSNWLIARGASVDRLYFGTDVRSVELLTGALLALWWMRRTDPLGPSARRVVSILSPIALVAMLLLWSTAQLDNLWFYRGGLTLYSVLTLVVIVGAMTSTGPVHRVLAWRPLVWVGVVSYGAYLLHFPILLWLQQHTGLATWQRLAIAMVLTFSAAAMSARWFEQPIRRGALVRTPRAALTGVGAVALTVLLVVSTTGLLRPVDRADFEAALEWQRFVEQTRAQEASEAPRVAVFGDSGALMIARGLDEVSRRAPDRFVTSPGWAQLGCGLLTSGNRLVRGDEREPDPHCLAWRDQWEQASIERPADVAAVIVGPWEVVPQQLEPGGRFLVIGEDPELDAALEASLREAVDALLQHHGMVVLVLPTDVEIGRVDGRSPDRPYAESDPARMELVRAMMRRVAADTDRVRTSDLRPWLADQDERALRPDGVHFTHDSSQLVAEWFGPELVREFREQTGSSTTQVGRR